MASGLNKHHILEAIDKLRSRKSRPDVLRIVSYVSKKYDFPKSDVKDYLEMLSKDGTVLKVEFKGSISYRNALKCRNSMSKMKSPISEDESSSKEESLGDIVAGTIGTMAQLIVQEPDYLDNGISLAELYNHIDSRHRKMLTKTEFKEILLKEVKNGNLVKFENGNYCLGYPTGEQVSVSPTLSDVSQSSNEMSKEKSKSPVSSVKKYAPASRNSSPASSKNSSTSSLNLPEKTSKPVKPVRTYTKSSKKMKEKAEENGAKNEGKDDKNSKVNDSSPIREGSRRKRFQKVVFDPSDNPKPKKMKEKDSPAAQPVKKIRGPYKKHLKETSNDSTTGSEKNKKETAPAPKISLNASKATPVKEEPQVKTEELSDNDAENESSQKTGNCKICHFSIDKSPRSAEKWIACLVCDKKAHITCIEDTEHWTRCKITKWQCNDCKSCVACKGEKESNDVGLILCGLCDDAYHIKCANIKKSKTTQKWFCNKCAGVFSDEVKIEKEEFESVGATSNEDSSQRTTPEPADEKIRTPERESNGRIYRKKSDGNKDIDESVPDCSNWTCEEVYLYFLKYVLPEEAVVFRDQEIDGKVLLLLTRYDVLLDFKLKLGPALKIYAQVRKLQLRKNDLESLWP